jgi:hypothetical protein
MLLRLGQFACVLLTGSVLLSAEAVAQGCPHGYDADLRGRCYPNGMVPREYQAARQPRARYPRGYEYRYYRDERPQRRYRRYYD